MARRSNGLEKAVEWANAAMAREDITSGERAWIRATIERVLMDTGTYHGFNYVAWYAGGYNQWEKDGKPEDNTKYLGDLSKIFFY